MTKNNKTVLTYRERRNIERKKETAFVIIAFIVYQAVIIFGGIGL